MPISLAQFVPNTMTSDKLLINETWAFDGDVDKASETSSPLSETSSDDVGAKELIPD